MRTLVDTNILLYAVNRDAPQHQAAAEYLNALWDGGERWCLSWANLYELLAVATHPGVLPNPLSPQQAWEVVERLIGHPSLDMLTETPRHGEVLREVLKDVSGARGAFFHDCRIAALMREHDISAIATADTDFRKFRFLKVLDPTRS